MEPRLALRISLFVLLAGAAGTPGARAEKFQAPFLLTEIDTPYQEKSPSISCDGLELYFHSNRPLGRDTGYHVFVARRPETGVPFGEPEPLIAEAGTPDISCDGLTLYFSMNVDGGGGLDVDLFLATRADRHSPFGPPLPLAELNTPYKEASPSISEDGLTLYFHSDRPGGAGRTDIWMATRAGLSLPFDPPVNLAEINTADQEFTPSLSRDGRKLYFASNRPGGLGAVDIWVAERTGPGGPFGPARNVTEVNSAGVEKACDISRDGLFLYLRTKSVSGENVSEISLAVDPRSGNVNRGAWPPAEVLTVNGSTGDENRVVRVAPGEAIRVGLAASPSGPSPARYALYALRAPLESNPMAPQPYDLGTTAFPTPLDGADPQPVVIANLFAGPRGMLLGDPLFHDLPPAPGIILEQPGGVPHSGSYFLQGFVEDLGAVGPYPLAVTNAVVLVVE